MDLIQLTKLTFKTIADKYKLYEEDIELIFACYDTNDMARMKGGIRDCILQLQPNCPADFLFDLICYIKQCEIEMEEEVIQ